MLRLAGKYADICYITPWNKMSQQEAREIVLEQAKRNGKERKISLAAAYTPLGSDERYERKGYRREVEEAAKSGFY